VRKNRALRIVVVAAGLASTTGCGAVMSTALILGAQTDLDGARAAEADELAAYEYKSAQEYLTKAREAQSYAQFGPAIDYAWRARELAEKANLRAAEQRAAPPPVTPPEVIEEGAVIPSANPSVIIEGPDTPPPRNLVIEPIPAPTTPSAPAPKPAAPKPAAPKPTPTPTPAPQTSPGPTAPLR